ncbi:tripartite tricarboxylate transporter permease [Magnetospira sp. QH-2]|uniref:tripartite tricarboxylate transporter permease n=1 Tax=Magnetospira sp. (strain QH-2) TaxID=1288970 RepID=UPI0003E80DD7|nr:tripartite tricarboxylate transporter permease [Magnetospira sp. QH-2]CCQ75240.1 conserved membrane protein of unknown function [Magnetospira sp. QH-2]
MTDLFNGFVFLFDNPMALGFVVLAAFVGVVIGALPGLTAAAAIAMLMPITFHLDPLTALAFLYVIGKSGRFGGSISAILFNTPGTAASAGTMQDGYPMTLAGKSGKALKMASVASVVGDFTGEIILIFGAVLIASFTESFGPPEYFAIYMMAFLVIGSVVTESVIKGLVSTMFGALISLIGLDPITGEPRMTLGQLELENGFSLVPLLIGVFVISEIIFQLEKQTNGSEKTSPTIADTKEGSRLTWSEIRRCIPIMLRSSVVGSVIGMMPGLGSSVAAFVAYGEERRRSKFKEKWGTGIIEGIAAPESANNAVSGPSMIPLLTLGVPGSTIAAILIGIFLIHGIQPGPMIFQTSRDLIFGLFAAGLVGILLYGLIGFYAGPMVGKIIGKVPARLIYPFIFLTAFVASYSARQSAFDIGVALVFGVIGYLLRKTGFSAAAFIIAFVLAKGAEEAYRQALLLSDSGAGIFFERPVVVGFLILGVGVMAFRAYGTWRKASRSIATKDIG